MVKLGQENKLILQKKLNLNSSLFSIITFQDMVIHTHHATKIILRYTDNWSEVSVFTYCW